MYGEKKERPLPSMLDIAPPCDLSTVGNISYIICRWPERVSAPKKRPTTATMIKARDDVPVRRKVRIPPRYFQLLGTYYLQIERKSGSILR